MVIAAVFGLVVPIASSSADICSGSIEYFSALPLIQAFIEYKFVSTNEVCSFFVIFLLYSVIVIFGAMLSGRTMPPILSRRALSDGGGPIEFWKTTTIICGSCLCVFVFLFLSYQYRPSASSLDSTVVAKIWFSTKLSLCFGSWMIGLACFHVLWSILDKKYTRV